MNDEKLIEIKRNIMNEVKDERGFLKELITGNWEQINLLFTKKDTMRGNHYHKTTVEFFYLIEGKVNFIVKDIKLNQRVNFEATNGDLIIIPILHHHILNFFEDTTMISGYTQKFNSHNPDLFTE